ncbi:hypothetical protein QAD02_004214 [Eretmocerus hayati]|uniref:Uncharacterized protein n=1 Tax=Eretmocerus hayati TaxID=131215 RepID=A0ACC2NP43_9HYME|nr:hypothetical protein QAD02_004214 [Eretmocerus hayati]
MCDSTRIMHRKQRERIHDRTSEDPLRSPNLRRTSRNPQSSNDHPHPYHLALSRHERASPRSRRRLANNTSLERHYRDYQNLSSSDECLTRNKSKSTSSIDTQSVNNILDEFEDLDYRRSSDLSDIDINNIKTTNFEEIMDMQKRQAAERNSRSSKVLNPMDARDLQESSAPIKVNRQTQVHQQRSRDRHKFNEKKIFCSTKEGSRFDRRICSAVPLNEEVRASIRSAKTPPEVLLKKGEVQKRVDEWLNQTRNQNCTGFVKESKGLTRSNSSAEQKSHRRLRQQELRLQRSQLNASSSYDDLTHDKTKTDYDKPSDGTKVSIGINASRGSYREYLALKNKSRLHKQQNESAKQVNDPIRSTREKIMIQRAPDSPRNETSDSRSRSSEVRKLEFCEPIQQSQTTPNSESSEAITLRSKSTKSRHQMENRISSLVKARNEASEMTSDTPISAITRRSSFRRESMRASSKSSSSNTSMSPSKIMIPTLPTSTNAEAIENRVKTDEAPLNVKCEQSNASQITDQNRPIRSDSGNFRENQNSVNSRSRTFKTNSRLLQGSNVLIETRNRSPMSPTKKNSFQFNIHDGNPSTFKPMERTSRVSPCNDRSPEKESIEGFPASNPGKGLQESILTPEVIHADDLESVFTPSSTNFVYGVPPIKNLSSSFAGFDDIRCDPERKMVKLQNSSSNTFISSGLNSCLKLLHKSPNLRSRRPHLHRKNNEGPKVPNLGSQVRNHELVEVENSHKTFRPAGVTMESHQLGSLIDLHKNEIRNQAMIQEPQQAHNYSYETTSTLRLHQMKPDLAQKNKLLQNEVPSAEARHVDSELLNSGGQLKRDLSTPSVRSEPFCSSEEGITTTPKSSKTLIKNLQFKRSSPQLPPPPPPRNLTPSTLKSASPCSTSFNSRSVLNDNYNVSPAQPNPQSRVDVSNSKALIGQDNLYKLLKRGDIELAKLVSRHEWYPNDYPSINDELQIWERNFS